MTPVELNNQFIRDEAHMLRRLGLTVESARDGLTIVVRNAGDEVLEIMTDHEMPLPFARVTAFLTGYGFAKNIHL